MNTRTMLPLGIALAAACPAVADVNVEARPANQTVNQGDVAEVGLYLVSDGGIHPVSAAEIVITWETQHLALIGAVNNPDLDFMIFPEFPPYLPLNASLTDGDAMYFGLAEGAIPFNASPGGLLLTTLRFDTLTVTGPSGTPVGLPASLDNPLGETIIWDGTMPNTAVTGTLTGAVVVIEEGDQPCPGEGDCCVPNGSPGCNNAACCNLVCAVDPFCCDTSWDSLCATEAKDLCGDLCPECGDAGTGPCCVANGTAYCDDADCCNAVCQDDPSCCTDAWDQLCADLAAQEPLCGCVGCGDLGTGDCCEANPTPYCDDEECCELICDIDPYCCGTEWDGTCANLAQEHCSILCPTTGACCFPDGSCLDGLTQDDCEAMTDGEFQGIDTECLGSDARIIVWGVDDESSDDSQLFVLNIATAELELVGDEHDDADIEAIAFFGDQAVGVRSGDDDDDDDSNELVDMDFSTGDLTFIAHANLPSNETEITGMATDGFGVVWAFADDIGIGTLEIDGDFTLLIPTYRDLEGLAAALDGETLWGITDDGEIYEIDVSSGSVVQIDDVGGEFDDHSIENLELFSSNELAFFTEDGDDLEFSIYNVHTGAISTTELRDLDLEDVEAFVFASIAACPSALTQGCGTALAGDCCSENSTAGCVDVGCCNTVCGLDPFCCATRWDALCASEAKDACGELCACALPQIECYAQVAPTFNGDNGNGFGFGPDGTDGDDSDASAFGPTSVPEPDGPQSLPAGDCGNGCSLLIGWQATSATGCDLAVDAVVQMNGQTIAVVNGQIIEVDCLGLSPPGDDMAYGFGHAGDNSGPAPLLIVTAQDADGNTAGCVLNLCEACEDGGGTAGIDDDNPPENGPSGGGSIGGEAEFPP